MNVTLKYFAQVREAAGVEAKDVQLPEGSDVTAAVERAAAIHGDAFRALVLSEEGGVRPSLLLLVNSMPVPRGSSRKLRDGDEVRIFSAVAGG